MPTERFTTRLPACSQNTWIKVTSYHVVGLCPVVVEPEVGEAEARFFREWTKE